MFCAPGLSCPTGGLDPKLSLGLGVVSVGLLLQGDKFKALELGVKFRGPDVGAKFNGCDMDRGTIVGTESMSIILAVESVQFGTKVLKILFS